MRVLVVLGTRPEAIKLAPMIEAMRADTDIEPILVSTGQHREMTATALEWFGLTPDHDLAIMTPGQTLTGVVTQSMSGLDALILEHAPDAVVAQGDTATVFAAALAAFHRQIPFGHVEAGLRTYDLEHPFPEEGYRQLVSRITRWHFCPTERAAAAVRDEKGQGETHVVGNTVVDALLSTAERVKQMDAPVRGRRYVLITGHRRENHGAAFDALFGALARLAEMNPDVDFIYPVHLNPNVQKAAHAHLGGKPNIQLIEPVSYPEIVRLMLGAAVICTDSGGIQEEAPSFGVPVLVMRQTTERQEAVDAGVCELVGSNPERMVERAHELLAHPERFTARNTPNPFGDGLASRRICDVLTGRKYTPFHTK
ncbi:non-hydrolyzing UDP-N-acetylglucosamine 2-epimerase [Glycocaulis sp.]|uniref:non-hydrolyzing UDP-N-acetylglucosamine 2-epimerase n=1 Tax=Glycocaulis sp. TaxID=1969725 RepID=UPI003D1C1C8A